MVWTRTLLSSHLIISIAPVSCSRTHAVCRCWWVMRSNIVSLLCSFGKWQNLLFLPQACIGWWVPAQKKPLSFELLGFSSKPHPGWVGSVFRLASVCHWERKTKMSFCHRDDKKKKARLAGNGAVTGPWVCAFNQHCLLSHRVLPGKETTSLNKKLEDDQQTTKGSWSFPEKAAERCRWTKSGNRYTTLSLHLFPFTRWISQSLRETEPIEIYPYIPLGMYMYLFWGRKREGTNRNLKELAHMLVRGWQVQNP